MPSFFESYSTFILEEPGGVLQTQKEFGRSPLTPWASNRSCIPGAEIWETLAHQPVSSLIPTDPYAPSPYRGEKTLAQWDFILCSGISKRRSVFSEKSGCPLRDIRQIRGQTINNWWREAWEFRAHNRVDQAPYAMNLTLYDGQELLRMAHAATHGGS